MIVIAFVLDHGSNPCMINPKNSKQKQGFFKKGCFKIKTQKVDSS